jgi:hypothetical protein
MYPAPSDQSPPPTVTYDSAAGTISTTDSRDNSVKYWQEQGSGVFVALSGVPQSGWKIQKFYDGFPSVTQNGYSMGKMEAERWAITRGDLILGSDLKMYNARIRVSDAALRFDVWDYPDLNLL